MTSRGLRRFVAGGDAVEGRDAADPALLIKAFGVALLAHVQGCVRPDRTVISSSSAAVLVADEKVEDEPSHEFRHIRFAGLDAQHLGDVAVAGSAVLGVREDAKGLCEVLDVNACAIAGPVEPADRSP